MFYLSEITMYGDSSAKVIPGYTVEIEISSDRRVVRVSITKEDVKTVAAKRDEIQAGVGYGMIASYADTKIYKAVLSNQTNGNGYAILSAISQNVLRTFAMLILPSLIFRCAL